MENLRRRLNGALNNKGIKLIFISKKLQIPRSTLSYFKRGERDLPKKYIDRLENYLNEIREE